MVSTRQLVGGGELDAMLTTLSRGREVFTLEAGEDGDYHLVRAERWDPGAHTLGAYRPAEPLKSLFFPPRAFLGPLFGAASPSVRAERMVIGVKNCDLAGLTIQDHVFRGVAPGDPAYAEARAKTILVSCDCTDCREGCFCPVVGEQPYPESGYDLNLSPLSGGQVLIDVGSVRGEALLEEIAEYLVPADAAVLAEREACRAALRRKLVDQAARQGLAPGLDLAGAVRGAEDSGLWGDFAADCVECGACNFVCCTCHCFLLADGTAGGVPARATQWDSCLLMNFARVAGGGNPRARRAARLRNRFEKKFDYFPEVSGRYACDGCGRCIDACLGNIDIRAVLKRAMDECESVSADRGDD